MWRWGWTFGALYRVDPSRSAAAEERARFLPLEWFWRAWRDIAADAAFPMPERAALIPVSALGFRLARRVRVNIASLNIRREPGLNAPAVGRLRRDQVVEIVREVNGWGNPQHRLDSVIVHRCRPQLADGGFYHLPEGQARCAGNLRVDFAVAVGVVARQRVWVGVFELHAAVLNARVSGES